MRVACWSPRTPSQIHRFTSVLKLLQLGVEVLYVDMDTFAVGDFVTSILRI